MGSPSISPVTDANVSATLSPRPEPLRREQLRPTVNDMSEDRPADDQGEGVDAAVGLPSDVLQELVGPVRRKPPPRLHDPSHDAPC